MGEFRCVEEKKKYNICKPQNGGDRKFVKFRRFALRWHAISPLMFFPLRKRETVSSW